MRGLTTLMVDACWPVDCPARRQARRILIATASTWVGVMVTAVLLGAAFVGRH